MPCLSDACAHWDGESLVDQRRLRTGALALDASSLETDTIDEVRLQIGTISAGIAALQSLDDLGPEANARASRDEQELWKRLKALEQRCRDLEGKKVTP